MTDITKTSKTAKLRHYLLQGLLTFVILGGVLAILHGIAGSVLLAASLASTAFLVFARPHSPESKARNIVGGHVVAVCFGAVFALIAAKFNVGEYMGFTLGALAVGMALIVMTITDTEHAPAAGVALGMTVAHADMLIMASTTLAGAILLTLARVVFQKYLYDLT